MLSLESRRAFLKSASGGALLACSGASPLAGIGAAVAGQPQRRSNVVPLRPEIEPVVELLEETPREQLLEAVAARIRNGLGYNDLLAALLLAGVRNVEPRPSVGFKFHAVLVAQSVHLLSLTASERDRWLPLFWALDYFKDSQAQDERERGWTMPPVKESALPGESKARAALVDALERWDESASDASIARLARTAPPHEIWEILFRYGARDFRSIGHKAIDVANSHRVLGVIGWRHAEPILRSLVYALLMHEAGNPAHRDDPADRPWRQNLQQVNQITAGWQNGKVSDDATRELLAVLRNGSADEAAETVVGLLARGSGPQSIWDGLFLAAGELLVRQPGIVALHAVTTTNSLHYAFLAAREDVTRRLILLQNAAFLPMFRNAMQARGRIGEFAIDQMAPLPPDSTGAEAVEEILAEVGKDPMTAARKTCGYLQAGGSLTPWIEKARQAVILKGSGAHDFKFGGAVLEDVLQLSPAWQGPYLASAAFQLQGSGEKDNPLVERSRRALAG